MNNLIKHPLWLVGFRPFFTLAFISGALLPFIWAAFYLGWLPLETSGLSPLEWHAHEMLFGFGWAVLGGFLLTASKNWVKIRGLHGGPLALAALFWCLERIAVPTLPAEWPGAVRFVCLNLFLVYLVAYVVWCLVRYRRVDSFKDNYFFIIALPLFLFAKNLVLSPLYFQAGAALAIGLYRLAFAVMFERTMTQFMKNAMSIELRRSPFLDLPIKALLLLGAFQAFLPDIVAAAVLLAAGALLFVRFTLWSPLQGFQNFGIAIMYVGYLGLSLHLVFEAFRLTQVFTGIGSLSTHVFTFLCMGVVIPGMMIRISQGHTGRKLLFTRSDRFAFAAMGLAAFFRLVATQVWPAHYNTWVGLAGFGWTICFSVLGWRLIPFLWKPRVDGREH